MSGWKQGDLYESIGRDLERAQLRCAQLERELEQARAEYEPSPRNQRPVVYRPQRVKLPKLPRASRWVFSGPGAVELGCAQDPDQSAALCLYWRRKRGAHAPAPPHRRERVLRYVDPVWPDWRALEAQLEAAQDEAAMLGGVLELFDQQLAELLEDRAERIGRQLRLELDLEYSKHFVSPGLIARQGLLLDKLENRAAALASELAQAREAQQAAEHRALAAEEEARLLLANPVYYQRRRGGP